MTKINFGNRAHWNMFTADKKELIDVYNNIVERFNLNEENYFMSPNVEFRMSVSSDGAILLWYYPKDIEEVDNRSAKTCFQYKIDLYKDNSMPLPRFMIHFDEPAFYVYEADDSGKTIVVKNKKLNMTITQRILAGKFFIKPVLISSPIDLTTRTIYECRLEEVEYSVAPLRQMANLWNGQLKVNNRVSDIACNIKSTQMIEPCNSIEEVEEAFFKYINDLKVKMKVFQIKQIGADEDDY